MVIVIADTSMNKLGVYTDFALDLETGTGTRNDFELSGIPASGNNLVWIPGTELGGIISSDNPKKDATGESISYSGTTWRGMLDQFITRPPAGIDHLQLSGSVQNSIQTLFTNAGCSSPFVIDPGDEAIVSYTVSRFATLYEALVGMLASVGLVLNITATDDGVHISAKTPAQHSDNVSFRAERGFRPVNHLVVLGKGELQQREIVDLYADANGNVSTTQTLTGIYEVAETYEQSALTGAELTHAGKSKLKEYQEQRNQVTISNDENLSFEIGDEIQAEAPKFGILAKASITGLVAKHSRGVLAIEAKTNGTLSTKSYE